MNILYSGLTQEQVENLHKWEKEQCYAEGVAKTQFEDVSKLVANTKFDVAEACEILGVDIAAYNEYLAGGDK